MLGRLAARVASRSIVVTGLSSALSWTARRRCASRSRQRQRKRRRACQSDHSPLVGSRPRKPNLRREEGELRIAGRGRVSRGRPRRRWSWHRRREGKRPPASSSSPSGCRSSASRAPSWALVKVYAYRLGVEVPVATGRPVMLFRRRPARAWTVTAPFVARRGDLLAAARAGRHSDLRKQNDEAIGTNAFHDQFPFVGCPSTGPARSLRRIGLLPACPWDGTSNMDSPRSIFTSA